MARLIAGGWALVFSWLLLVGCTSQPDARTAQPWVMHFPLNMTIDQDRLLVSSTSADGKYDHGRLVLIDLVEVKNQLDAKAQTSPFSFAKVAKSSKIIPKGAGNLTVTSSHDTLLFASRDDAQILVSSLTDKLPCSDNDEPLSQCPGVATQTCAFDEPSEVAVLAQVGTKVTYVASSFNSDDIAVYSGEMSGATPQKTLVAQYHAATWATLAGVTSKKKVVFVTKKIRTSPLGDTIYLVVEKHREYRLEEKRPQGAYLLKIKAADLVSGKTLVASDLTLWDLQEKFSISGVHDFFVDEATQTATILASKPELIVQVDLSKKLLLGRASVCRGASMMASSPGSNFLAVPCFLDNLVTTFDKTTLALDRVTQLNEGPAYAVIDEKRGLIFVTTYLDGRVVVLNQNLELQGYIFNKAPRNQVGS